MAQAIEEDRPCLESTAKNLRNDVGSFRKKLGEENISGHSYIS
jgi:hypothetical protein